MQLNTADSSNVDKRHRDQPGRARPKRQPVYQLRCKLIPTLLRRLRFQPGGNLGRLCSSSCPRSGRLLRHVGTLSRACIYAIDRSKSGDLNVRSHYHIEMPRTSIAGGAGAPPLASTILDKLDPRMTIGPDAAAKGFDHSRRLIIRLL